MGDFSKSLDAFRKKTVAKMNEIVQSAPKDFGELLTEDFMARHTSFTTVQAMFDASGIPDSTEFVEGAASERWQRFIREKTQFTSWEAMIKAATDAWAAKHQI